jgi:hypothetical protein
VVLVTCSRDSFSVRTCIMQNQSKVDNFNTSLACNRLCTILASLCVSDVFCYGELQFFTGASPTHEFSSILAFVVGVLLPNEHTHAHCVAMTELHMMLY